MEYEEAMPVWLEEIALCPRFLYSTGTVRIPMERTIIYLFVEYISLLMVSSLRAQM